MEKLKIVGKKSSKDTITRTVRMSGASYDKIVAIAESKEISFNNVINQLIEYSLDNLDESKEKVST